jgi:hypothetical protein
MDRRLGPDIPEGDYGFVSINDISLDVAFDNATEKTITHQISSSTRLIFLLLAISIGVLDEYLSIFHLDWAHSGARHRR